MAVACAVTRTSGVVALDEDAGDVMRCIEFPRIKGGKPFKSDVAWFQEMVRDIGQVPADAYPVSMDLK